MTEIISSDYHLHSNFSDGILTPQELVQLATELKITQLALTDHDTMDGVDEFFALARAKGIEPIAGMEVSSAWRASNIHILAYWQDYEKLTKAQLTKIFDFIHLQKNLRLQRAKLITQALNKLDYKIDFAEICAFAAPSVPTRPHFAKYLIAAGYFSDFGEVFVKLLGKGKVGDISLTWLPMQEVVVRLKAMGAKLALAHPYAYNLSLGALKQLFRDFKLAGGMALEVVNSIQDPAKTKALANYCKEYNFKMIWGSDFHSPQKSQLGRISPLPRQLNSLI